jgi:pyruvate dehydrogenase E2 component (dihydrolipoamide acetyltransferase)
MMATDVELPQLGESVTEGTITAWLVQVGDTVEADQPLFELSSDKIDTEVPSPTAGTVTEILVEVDETVEVGTVVARIGEESEAGGGGSADDAPADDAGAAEQDEVDADEPEQGGPAAAPQSASDEGGSGGGGGGGEAVDITLPELGESVTEGTITAWLVSVGDEVTEDQPLFELSSDKIDTEVPSPASGTISEILVEVDETVDVGTVVARLGGSGGSGGSGGGSASSDASSKPAADAGASPSGGYEQVPDDAEGRASGGSTPAGPDALASPLVRKLAADNDIDLNSVDGSGQGGRITRDDVQSLIDGGGASDAPTGGQSTTSSSTRSGGEPAERKTPGTSKPTPTAPRVGGERERVEDISRIRRRIADKMIESQASAAQLTTVQEADVTALMNARARHKETFKSREGVSLSPFAIVARAALMAIRNHPMINAAADWDAGKLYLRDHVNLGIAVDTPKGLLVPNVKGADGLTVAGLARGIAEAAQKARGEGRKLDFSDIEGGTFTLTNTGSVGVLIDTPILNYPEVAILGVGAIVRRPAVVTADDGTEAIAIRDMMYLSLTYDHRLLDGADAARYVTEVKHTLEDTDWDQEIG